MHRTQRTEEAQPAEPSPAAQRPPDPALAARLTTLQQTLGNRATAAAVGAQGGGAASARTPGKVVVGVPYRTDGRGSAHTGYDMKAVSAMSGLAGDVQVEGRTLPPGAAASGADTPARPAEASQVRAHLQGVDALLIPGAPSANDTQIASERGTPEDAGHNSVDAPKTKKHVREEHRSRAAYELALIEQAKNLGMPVIAVCAGSWRLLEAYGGAVETLPAAERALHTDKNNVWGLRHPVDAVSGTRLADAFTSAQPDAVAALSGAPVTSTHWAAASEVAPGSFRQSTQAAQNTDVRRHPDDILAVAARTSADGSSSVEAFETRSGAPVMGIQWHPETHLPDMPGRYTDAERTSPDPAVASSEALFRHFVQAALAYRYRRDMHDEFTKRPTQPHP
ncbi:gamma-glutamyl-gamma-aminobutyrate hydrolase family protein [Streptomyces roseifaciens]